MPREKTPPPEREPIDTKPFDEAIERFNKINILSNIFDVVFSIAIIICILICLFLH